MSEVDYTAFKQWIDKFMSAPPNPSDKIIGMKHFCSDVESGVVIVFKDKPEEPSGFMGQKCFHELTKLMVEIPD